MIKNIVLSLYNNKLKLKIRPQYEQQKYVAENVKYRN